MHCSTYCSSCYCIKALSKVSCVPAAIAAIELNKVIGLQQHVVELQEGQRLLPLESQPHALKGEHPVDGEVRPILSQKLHVAETTEPIIVVHQLRICWAISKLQELCSTVENIAVQSGIGSDIISSRHYHQYVLSKFASEVARSAVSLGAFTHRAVQAVVTRGS